MERLGFLFILLCGTLETAFSQSVGLNNPTPDASSILDLTATDRGLLVPRMTTTQRTTSIASPATGLLVYDTDLEAFYFHDGTDWKAVGSASADGNGIYDGSGSLVGATVVTQGANTLEFTSTVTDGFSVDGQTFSVDAAKNRVGIGTNSPETTLDVAGIIKSGQDGVDGEIQLYSEQGAPDFLYIISPNAAATQDVSLVLPPDEGNASEFLQTDGSGNLIWAAPAAATNAFATAANVTSNSPGDFTNDDFVFGSPFLDDDTDPNHDNRMLFDKSKGAFRAGGVTTTLWNDANRGNFSFAGGFNNTATGTYSTAFGTISDVNGSNAFGAGDNIYISSAGTAAFGFGWNNTATGIAAGVFGMNASAGGNRSFAMGEYVETTVNNAFALGKGVSNAARISNNITNSMMIGFNSDISTLYIGTASGAGTIGRVGVGTTSPSTTLEVQHNSASTTPLLELEQANATGDASMLIQNTTQAFTLGIDDDDSDKFKISDNTSLGTNDRLTIDGSGNVGIGTASPTTALDVEFALGANAGIDINNADPGTFDPRLRFQIDGTSVWAMGADDSDADKFKIATGGNIGAGAVITIDGSNSFVGIGTTSPATTLDVAGTAQMTGFKLTTAPTTGYILSSDAAGVGTWADPATLPGGNWTKSGNFVYNTADSIGVGTSTPEKKLEVDGDIKQRNTQNHTMTRTMPTVVSDYVEIGNIVFASTSGGAYGGNLWVSVSMGYSWPVLKSYIIPIAYNQTGSAWHTAIPNSVSHYANQTNADFDLEIMVSSATAFFRLRRTAGASALNAFVTIRHDGGTADVFNSTEATGTASAPTQQFTGTAITTVGVGNSSSNVGIGALTPSANLHV
ncbi:MAG TPA: hypothetical protein EYN51_08385, partial [Flavobacteriales bacterium]|nr:hypothetical protein [Flavobacteriales bacterium]